MTPKHDSEVELLRSRFRRRKRYNHFLQCPSCRAEVEQIKALHKARVAAQMNAATSAVDNPGGLTIVAFKKKPHLDATPHMPSASGNDKVH